MSRLTVLGATRRGARRGQLGSFWGRIHSRPLASFWGVRAPVMLLDCGAITLISASSPHGVPRVCLGPNLPVSQDARDIEAEAHLAPLILIKPIFSDPISYFHEVAF